MTSPPWIVFRPIQIGRSIVVLDEPDRAVAEAGVDAAGVAAARAGIGVVVRERHGDAGQLVPGVADAEPVTEPVAPARRRVGDAVDNRAARSGVNRVMKTRRQGPDGAPRTSLIWPWMRLAGEDRRARAVGDARRAGRLDARRPTADRRPAGSASPCPPPSPAGSDWCCPSSPRNSPAAPRIR